MRSVASQISKRCAMRCQLCSDFSAPTPHLLLKHIGRVHANAPRFSLRCIFGGCETTYTNFHSYKRHIRKKHFRELINQTESDQDSDCELDNEADYLSDEEQNIRMHASDESDLESIVSLGDHDTEESSSMEESSDREAALWILKLKEGRRLTQSTTEEILSDVTELCSSIVLHLKNEVHRVLESADIIPDNIPGLDDLFSESSSYAHPFCNLQTQYKQMSYFHSHFNFVVSKNVVSYVIYYVAMDDYL